MARKKKKARKRKSALDHMIGKPKRAIKKVIRKVNQELHDAAHHVGLAPKRY